MMFPSTAALLQHKLGLRGCAAMDVQAVCTGFIYALAVADKFFASGQSKCALVVGAEVFSRLLDWSDRRTCVLFGDGAGAVVLKPSDTPGILSTHLHADGSQSGILNVDGSVQNGIVQGRAFVHMDGPAVFKFAVRALDEVCRETLAANNMKGSDIDWLVPHQANIRIIQATADKLGLPRERVVTMVESQGNTSAASVPLALDAAIRAGRIQLCPGGVRAQAHHPHLLRHTHEVGWPRDGGWTMVESKANTSAASVPLACDAAIRDGRMQPGHKVMLEAVGGGMTWGAALLIY